MKIRLSILSVLLVLFLACTSCGPESSERQELPTESKGSLALTPPMGWNSFDSYGVYLHEEAAMENLEAMAKKLKPYGYEYFVIDNGWFGEYALQEGTMYSKEKHASQVKINEYGLLQPSDTYFPNGIKRIADRAHELGLKFGIHLMRGIPREAYRQNTLVKGTTYRAQDIADTTSICPWCAYNYGVDMDKPGAQEFYNSLVDQMSSWGVDFLKVDDIVPFPREVEAVANAVAQNERPMVLSLSPGGQVDKKDIDFFRKANMLRVTPDIWDEQEGIDQCFEAWKKWQGRERPGFWIDMDMIPFGELQIMSPKPNELSVTHQELKQLKTKGEFSDVALLSGKGWHRKSQFTKHQMYTFITMRSLAASPLMFGGDLKTIDDFSLSLITNQDMLECNQNGVMGKLAWEKDGMEIWITDQRESQNKWVGMFNRTAEEMNINVLKYLEEIGIPLKDYQIRDIWNDRKVKDNDLAVGPNGVLFLKLEKNN